MKLQSGHEIVQLEGAEMKKQHEDWSGYEGGLVRLNPGRWVFPTNYKLFADKLYNFEYRNTDVVVMTYPKCGTTWTQEIIWTMKNNPDLTRTDVGTHILTRSPFVDMDMLFPTPKPDGPPPPPNPFLDLFMKYCPGKNPMNGLNLQFAEAIPDPRTIKTHLPFSLMPPSLLDTCKVVYVARNPKDVIISYHHHCRIINQHGFRGTFEDFVKYFVDGDLVYGPYWLHLKEAWENKDHPNLHIIYYEDLKADPLREFTKLNSFLETNLSEQQLKNIVQYTSFGEMKSRAEKDSFAEEGNPGVFNTEIIKKDGGFFRKGVAGDWKGKLTPDLEAKVDDWIKTNLNFGMQFRYGV